MMTARDFEYVADEIAILYMNVYPWEFGGIVDALCRAFEQSNPRFNRVTFLRRIKAILILAYGDKWESEEKEGWIEEFGEDI